MPCLTARVLASSCPRVPHVSRNSSTSADGIDFLDYITRLDQPWPDRAREDHAVHGAVCDQGHAPFPLKACHPDTLWIIMVNLASVTIALEPSLHSLTCQYAGRRR
jgi:hypothetical protein